MSTSTSFWRTHLLLIPGTLALAALLAHNNGIDHALTAFFYDAAQTRFPAHASSALELFGHRFAKTAVTMVWLVLLAAVCSTYVWPRWRPQWTANRAALWSAATGMALGPIIVVGLKGLNAYHCPWDLIEFGGGAAFTSGWFVSAAEVGYCFPAGHAASGYCLVALYFLACELNKPAAARLALWATVLVGASFSIIRIAQGAHFLSHTLWSAAICWFIAALAFLPVRAQRPRLVAA
jgi:membrane-associated PAP2 superfamily phosphatase